jgi:hypothetical protein
MYLTIIIQYTPVEYLTLHFYPTGKSTALTHMCGERDKTACDLCAEIDELGVGTITFRH